MSSQRELKEGASSPPINLGMEQTFIQRIEEIPRDVEHELKRGHISCMDAIHVE